MKRAAAYILSLTVIWLQVTASAQTFPSAAAAGCDCCIQTEACRCCCVAPGDPDMPPLAALPIAACAPFDFTALASKNVAWVLPANASKTGADAEVFSSRSSIPLFQRDCALLI